jgi:hypothetical protein
LFRSSECFGYNRATFMAITIGQQLGSYEITSLLGKGGMGDVYPARDTKPVESDSNAAVNVLCSFGADRLRGVPGKIIKRTP